MLVTSAMFCTSFTDIVVVTSSGGYRGVAMVSAETPLKERAPLISDDR